MSLSIGILGTRGVPNFYGGFEQFAAFLSAGLAEKGHRVAVYNSHRHPYKEKKWKGVDIIHCFDPEYCLGSAGQFVYDLNCIMDARKRKFDILLVLGYTSSSVWGRWLPKKAVIITNMDGLEWKRSKYAAAVQKFLTYAEKWAVRQSDCHVADAMPIKEYLDEKYSINARYISYGAEQVDHTDESLLAKFNIVKGEYYLLIARMEPENHIEAILDGLAGRLHPVIVVGDIANVYGKKMKSKFSNSENIRFMGSLYEKKQLDALRSFCKMYFHGHSVGGTNPSLLEAMACGALICAHDNAFNRSILQDNAFYFFSAENVTSAAEVMLNETTERMRIRNREKINKEHRWERIIGDYEQLFMQSIGKNNA